MSKIQEAVFSNGLKVVRKDGKFIVASTTKKAQVEMPDPVLNDNAGMMSTETLILNVSGPSADEDSVKDAISLVLGPDVDVESLTVIPVGAGDGAVQIEGPSDVIAQIEEAQMDIEQHIDSNFAPDSFSSEMGSDEPFSADDNFDLRNDSLGMAASSKKLTKKAQAPNQNMPKDLVEEGEDDLEVPRNESVGFTQTKERTVKTYKYPYQFGDGGCDTSIVPRDSGDGLGGEKVTFESEKAEGQTSGNPDNYVQTLGDVTSPTPAGNKKNHAIANNDAIKKLAEKEEELLEAKRALQKTEIARERERVARKIVQAELDKGLISCASEEEVDERINSFLDMPTSALLRDLQRVKTLPNVNTVSASTDGTTKLVTTASNKRHGFIDYAGVALQSGVAAFNRSASYAPTLGHNTIRELADAVQDETYYGKLFPRNS